MLVVTLRRFAHPAVWALRVYWGTAALIAAAGMAALAAFLPVAALPHLIAPPLRTADLELGLAPLATSPSATRAAAVFELQKLLMVVAAGVVVVAVLTVVAVAVARAEPRVGELRVRRAVGASRRHLLGAGLLEGGLIGAMALLAGGAVGLAGARAAISAWPGGHGAGVVAPGIVGGAVLLAVILVGVLLPVAAAQRSAPLAGRGRARLPLAVPALQLGLSLTALTGAALLARRAALARGATRTGVLDGQVLEITTQDTTAPARAEAYAELVQRLGRRPGVRAVSLTSPGTLVGLGLGGGAITDCGNCADGGLPLQFHSLYATHYLISADTFRALNVRLVVGRAFTDSDRLDTPRVAVVNQTLAARHFETQGAIGRRIQIGRSPSTWYTVVGVVADHLPTGFGGGFQSSNAIYLSVLQHPASAVDLLVRAPGDSGITDAVERILGSTLGGGRARVVRRQESGVVAAEAAPVRWFGRLFETEGWVMLAVAIMGTFVVVRLWVAARLHELGLRRAVGARRRDVVGFVLARAMGVAAAGLAIGLWCGGFLWGALTAVVAGLPSWDTATVLRFGALLIVAALVGALLPALRAAHATPAWSMDAQGG